MWKSLAKFTGACLTGDVGAALDALNESPEPGDTPKDCKEGDPPCGKADPDGKARCSGHGPGGTCILTEVQ